MTAPIGKLVRYKAMATGDIHNPGPGLKALRHNPRLHMIRPPPVPTPTLNNITPPNKPIHTIRHARPPSVTEDLLAGASPNENARNQWDGDAAYAEITQITWDDFEKQHKRVLVRDMKHPGEKIGNDTWVDLPDEAIQVIESMPKTKPEIFPYSPDAITANFTRACKLLGIEDLRFHDLRHEGISRLFEMGWNIPKVATVSGHRSWVSLKRYTHIREAGDKYVDWRGLQLAISNR